MTMREIISEYVVDKDGYARLEPKGELVRCGECRRAILFSCAGNRNTLCHCNLFDATMKRTDFCNYGERKEKEECSD